MILVTWGGDRANLEKLGKVDNNQPSKNMVCVELFSLHHNLHYTDKNPKTQKNNSSKVTQMLSSRFRIKTQKVSVQSPCCFTASNKDEQPSFMCVGLNCRLTNVTNISHKLHNLVLRTIQPGNQDPWL